MPHWVSGSSQKYKAEYSFMPNFKQFNSTGIYDPYYHFLQAGYTLFNPFVFVYFLLCIFTGIPPLANEPGWIHYLEH